jgi:hypothetical protein
MKLDLKSETLFNKAKIGAIFDYLQSIEVIPQEKWQKHLIYNLKMVDKEHGTDILHQIYPDYQEGN